MRCTTTHPTTLMHALPLAPTPSPAARVALLEKLTWPPAPFQSPGMGLGSKVTSTLYSSAGGGLRGGGLKKEGEREGQKEARRRKNRPARCGSQLQQWHSKIHPGLTAGHAPVPPCHPAALPSHPRPKPARLTADPVEQVAGHPQLVAAVNAHAGAHLVLPLQGGVGARKQGALMQAARGACMQGGWLRSDSQWAACHTCVWHMGKQCPAATCTAGVLACKHLKTIPLMNAHKGAQCMLR